MGKVEKIYEDDSEVDFELEVELDLELELEFLLYCFDLVFMDDENI